MCVHVCGVVGVCVSVYVCLCLCACMCRVLCTVFTLLAVSCSFLVPFLPLRPFPVPSLELCPWGKVLNGVKRLVISSVQH